MSKNIFKLGQEDAPRLQSLADMKERKRNLKLMLCAKCFKNPSAHGIVPELLIEGVNINKIKKAESCWYCGKKK